MSMGLAVTIVSVLMMLVGVVMLVNDEDVRIGAGLLGLGGLLLALRAGKGRAKGSQDDH